MPARSKALRIKRSVRGYKQVLAEVVELLESSRHASIRAVNTFMTTTYWQIGKRIVESEQRGEIRALYGEELLETLARDLTARFGRGFSRRNLSNMRLFYLSRPILQAPSAKLLPPASLIWQTLSAKSSSSPHSSIWQTPSAKSQPFHIFQLPWSHYTRLLSVDNPDARSFYEAEALRGGWSMRQLDRQINSLFFERTALSKNKKSMLKRGQQPVPGDLLSPEDHFKNPFILEFLGLKDEYSESELEDALIRHLENFLLELGDDFCFIGRQRRLRIGDQWHRIDLLFFHRRLRCQVVIDLKIGPFTSGDAGDMNLYTNYAKENWMRPGENPPVGLILCAQKDATVARYALDNLPNKILAAQYRLKLPNERSLIKLIQKSQIEFESRVITRRGKN